MSHSRDLAIALAGGRDGVKDVSALADMLHMGIVSAVGSRNDGGATYTVVTVDGIEMRCLGWYAAPAVLHTVVYLRTPKQVVCLGPML